MSSVVPSQRLSPPMRDLSLEMQPSKKDIEIGEAALLALLVRHNNSYSDFIQTSNNRRRKRDSGDVHPAGMMRVFAQPGNSTSPCSVYLM